MPSKKPPVVVILMENHEYGSVAGAASAPYLNRTLIPSGTLFTNYYAVSHPSLPNYLALTVGGTCGKAGPGVPAGARDGTFYTHYGLLAGIERYFGLPLLANARTATPLPV